METFFPPQGNSIRNPNRSIGSIVEKAYAQSSCPGTCRYSSDSKTGCTYYSSGDSACQATYSQQGTFTDGDDNAQPNLSHCYTGCGGSAPPPVVNPPTATSVPQQPTQPAPTTPPQTTTCNGLITISGGVRDHLGRGVPGAKVCLDPGTQNCANFQGTTDGNGTYFISNVQPGGNGHSVYLDPNSLSNGSTLTSGNYLLSNTCSNDIKNFTVTTSTQPTQPPATTAPNIPTQIPTSAAPTITIQPGAPTNPPASVVHILQTITIENKDNGTGGTILPPIPNNTYTLLDALSTKIKWKLNDLKEGQNQERVVQVTLFDGTNYVPFKATVKLIRSIIPTEPINGISPTIGSNGKFTINSTPETIDTLVYFLTHHRDESLNGGHLLSQTIDENKKVSYYVKGDSALFYELHTWDDQYIYLKEDRTFLSVPSTTFSDGRWMKRYMKVGETININSANIFQLYDQTLSNLKCTKRINAAVIDTSGKTLEGQTAISGPFTYRMMLEKHDPAFDIGGDLGIQDVIIVKYEYGNAFERFYYSKEWGWIKWEVYGKNNPNPIDQKTFNLRSKTSNPFPFIKPDQEASCLNPSNNIVHQDTPVLTGKPPPCFGKFNNNVFGYGDIDGDGVLTQKDYDLLRTAFNGSTSLTADQQARAYIDGKNVFSAADVGLLGEYLGDKRTTFPVCSKGN